MKKYVTIQLVFIIVLLVSSANTESFSVSGDTNEGASANTLIRDVNVPGSARLSKIESKSNGVPVSIVGEKPCIQSLVFARNMAIVDALQLLAAKYNKNIIHSSKISGNINFTKLNNVTFEEAMSAILGTDYRYQNQGNIIKVYTLEEYQKISPQEGDMICKVFTLYYISAVEARKMVTSVLSKDGKVETMTPAQTGVPNDDKTIGPQQGGGDSVAINDMILVMDYPERITRAEKVIAAIDVRPQQVLVEAVIMTATLTDSTQLGVDWIFHSESFISTIEGVSNEFVEFGGTSTSIDSVNPTDGMTIGVLKGDVSAIIRALEKITDVTILANPKILAANKQVGQVYIGTKVAYQSQTSQSVTSTTQQVQFLDTGTKLSFRPYIGNDGYIRMDIHPKDSSATLRQSGEATLPDETSAELSTNIIVKDGETIVIGGLFRDKVQANKTQVPFLGNIPIIGALFSSHADKVTREEVIVLMTPYIIAEPNQAKGRQTAEDINRKLSGAMEELHPTSRMRLARQHYEKAIVYYSKDKKRQALDEVNNALNLYPAYEEAIELKEKIQNEADPPKKPTREIISQTKKSLRK